MDKSGIISPNHYVHLSWSREQIATWKEWAILSTVEKNKTLSQGNTVSLLLPHSIWYVRHGWIPLVYLDQGLLLAPHTPPPRLHFDDQWL